MAVTGNELTCLISRGILRYNYVVCGPIYFISSYSINPRHINLFFHWRNYFWYNWTSRKQSLQCPQDFLKWTWWHSQADQDGSAAIPAAQWGCGPKQAIACLGREYKDSNLGPRAWWATLFPLTHFSAPNFLQFLRLNEIISLIQC